MSKWGVEATQQLAEALGLDWEIDDSSWRIKWKLLLKVVRQKQEYINELLKHTYATGGNCK